MTRARQGLPASSYALYMGSGAMIGTAIGYVVGAWGLVPFRLLAGGQEKPLQRVLLAFAYVSAPPVLWRRWLTVLLPFMGSYQTSITKILADLDTCVASSVCLALSVGFQAGRLHGAFADRFLYIIMSFHSLLDDSVIVRLIGSGGMLTIKITNWIRTLN